MGKDTQTNSVEDEPDALLVIRCTKELENLLKEKFNAQGQGLHQYMNSCTGAFPKFTADKVHHIASVRNQFVHNKKIDTFEDTFRQTEHGISRQQFIELYKQCRAGVFAIAKAQEIKKHGRVLQNVPKTSLYPLPNRPTPPVEAEAPKKQQRAGNSAQKGEISNSFQDSQCPQNLSQVYRVQTDHWIPQTTNMCAGRHRGWYARGDFWGIGLELPESDIPVSRPDPNSSYEPINLPLNPKEWWSIHKNRPCANEFVGSNNTSRPQPRLSRSALKRKRRQLRNQYIPSNVIHAIPQAQDKPSDDESEADDEEWESFYDEKDATELELAMHWFPDEMKILKEVGFANFQEDAAKVLIEEGGNIDRTLSKLQAFFSRVHEEEVVSATPFVKELINETLKSTSEDQSPLEVARRWHADELELLVEMGFAEAEAAEELYNQGYNINQAAANLIQKRREKNDMESKSEDVNCQDNRPPQKQSVTSTQASQSTAQRALAKDYQRRITQKALQFYMPELELLRDFMGFDEEQASMALLASEGNVDQAVEILAKQQGSSEQEVPTKQPAASSVPSKENKTNTQKGPTKQTSASVYVDTTPSKENKSAGKQTAVLETWMCQVCTLDNNSSATSCEACETPRYSDSLKKNSNQSTDKAHQTSSQTDQSRHNASNTKKSKGFASQSSKKGKNKKRGKKKGKPPKNQSPAGAIPTEENVQKEISSEHLLIAREKYSAELAYLTTVDLDEKTAAYYLVMCNGDVEQAYKLVEELQQQSSDSDIAPEGSPAAQTKEKSNAIVISITRPSKLGLILEEKQGKILIKEINTLKTSQEVLTNLQVEDVIISINGGSIKTMNDAKERLGEVSVGSMMVLEVERKHETSPLPQGANAAKDCMEALDPLVLQQISMLPAKHKSIREAYAVEFDLLVSMGYNEANIEDTLAKVGCDLEKAFEVLDNIFEAGQNKYDDPDDDEDDALDFKQVEPLQQDDDSDSDMPGLIPVANAAPFEEDKKHSPKDQPLREKYSTEFEVLLPMGFTERAIEAALSTYGRNLEKVVEALSNAEQNTECTSISLNCMDQTPGIGGDFDESLLRSLVDMGYTKEKVTAALDKTGKDLAKALELLLL